MATTNAIDLSETLQQRSSFDDLHSKIALTERQTAIENILNDILPRLHKTTAVSAVITKSDLDDIANEHVTLLMTDITKELELTVDQLIDLYAINEGIKNV
ncbi:hypothetical protein [Photobacterium leiognathi]|uniref:hypothetical protein n=2 Tax=Photobacterium leiognathi TaxID=553611 RepID=UPI00273884C7|nr:hypothetical protein [Photobacterium leiognathi]